jgi:K+-sensing histidine kinase KdpD
MYAEMLAEGMVRSAKKRKAYYTTLKREAERLSHLVENVLAYARLERKRMGYHIETVTVGELLAGFETRLSERAAQAGMSLLVESDEEKNAMCVRADVSAVGQILFNLVDNACKYCTSAKDKRIHLEIARSDDCAGLRVRDHGPGVSKKDGPRIFKPFCKSAHEAAQSAPGVGLGLALSYRLAREMAGALRLDATVTDGACFELSLPLAE